MPRLCKVCQQTKDDTDFYPHWLVCKLCTSLKRRAAYQKIPRKKSPVCLSCGASPLEVPFPKKRAHCVPCWRRKIAEYRATRPETNRAYREKYKPKRRAYLDANAERIAAVNKEYQRTHKEEIQSWTREYQRTSPVYKKTRKDWEAKNKEHLQSYLRAYHDGRREAIRAYKKKYYAEHREEHAKRSKEYRAKYPEKTHEYSSRRYYRLKNSHNDLTYAQWLEILAAYDYRCVYCPASCPDCKKRTHKLTQDHVTPISKGGHHTRSNIVPACGSCNSSKRDRPPPVPVQPLLLTIAEPKPRTYRYRAASCASAP